MILLLLACQPEFVVEPAEPSQLLRRLSLDLRGVLPEQDEFVQLQQGQSSVEQLREDYLSSPQLGERVVDWYGEQWHTLIDVYDVVHEDYYLDDAEEYSFERAVGEEPLRLVASVVSENQHYSGSAGRAQHSYATSGEYLATRAALRGNRIRMGHCQLHRWQTRDGCAVNQWPMVALHHRRKQHEQGRAAALSRLLLCEDPLARPVSSRHFVTELGTASTENAIRQNPACTSCHATLDPLAASLLVSGGWNCTLPSSTPVPP